MGTGPSRFGLPKDERLHGRKDIAELLAKGRFRVCRSMKYCVRKGNSLPYSRIMVSVSKRLFKRAVKRNLLKRRIRESYRLQKHRLPEGNGMDILFVYNTREILDSKEIYSTVGQILKEISSDGSGKN